MVLMIIGYGITMDVGLSHAAFDRDQTSTSLNYRNALLGSRYFNNSQLLPVMPIWTGE